LRILCRNEITLEITDDGSMLASANTSGEDNTLINDVLRETRLNTAASSDGSQFQYGSCNKRATATASFGFTAAIRSVLTEASNGCSKMSLSADGFTTIPFLRNAAVRSATSLLVRTITAISFGSTPALMSAAIS